MHKIVKILVVIGGLNWGLVGMGMFMSKDLNVVHMIFSSMPAAEAAVYVLVGLAALSKLFCCKCKKCKEACASCDSCKTENKDQNM